MSLIRLDLLDPKRKKAFERLGVFKKEAVLAGGTALCLQIGHRYSFDFDLFFKRLIKRNDLLKVKKCLGVKKVQINFPEQLTIITPDDIGSPFFTIPTIPSLKRSPPPLCRFFL